MGLLSGALALVSKAVPVVKAVVSKVISKSPEVVLAKAPQVATPVVNIPVQSAVQKIQASYLTKGVALGSVAVGSYIAGGSQVGKVATGSAIAAAGAGTGAGLLVGGSALVNSALNKPASTPTPVAPVTPVERWWAGGTKVDATQSAKGQSLVFVESALGSHIPPKDALGQVASEEKEPAPVVTALEQNVKKVSETISSVAAKEIAGGVSVGDVAKVAGTAALAAGVAVVAHKASKKKGKKKKAAVRSGVSKPSKRKAGTRKAAKKGQKLKFGSPAWRKKYMKPKKKKAAPAKKKKGMKGSGSYYEIEAQSHGLKAPSGHKLVKVGTEAQYNAKGGKKVEHDSRGRPYITLESGMRRYIKKS